MLGRRAIGLLEVPREGHLALELGLLCVRPVCGARLVRGSACELVVEVLWPEDGHFDEEQFARDRARLRIVQNGPHGHLKRHDTTCVERGDKVGYKRGRGGVTHEVFELAPRLFDDAVLAADDDAHPAQVSDLGAAHDQRVDVEPAPREDPRDAR